MSDGPGVSVLRRWDHISSLRVHGSVPITTREKFLPEVVKEVKTSVYDEE